MSAPALWIGIPIAVAGLALLLTDRGAALAGAIVCLLLACLAAIVPIDEAILAGPLSFKVVSTASLLGRDLIIGATAGPMLTLLYGLCAAWFTGAYAAGVARRLVPIGLSVTALLVASVAVRPFLYAALLIELAALAAVPLVAPQGTPPSRSAMKFLTYQTLGMPCMLLAGWLLAGVEASPGDLALTIQATVLLSLGFAFLLAVFPLHDWMPGLMAEGRPYQTAFLLWVLPSVIIIFSLGFLDGYSWLRTSKQVIIGIRTLGLLMVVTSGLWAAVETNLGRMLGFAAIMENGLILVATSLTVTRGTDAVFPFFIPRGVAMLTWGLGLAILSRDHGRMDLTMLREARFRHPWACAAIVVASISVAGIPPLAGFPARLDVLDGLADTSSAAAAWLTMGLIGLVVGAVRQLAQVSNSQRSAGDVSAETPLERAVLGLGMLSILVLGVAPRIGGFVVDRLPLMFPHLFP